jgi:hypothetical protein
MALALVVIAAVQVATIVAGLRLARQLSTTADEFRREVRPLIEKANLLVDDANRVTSLALAQVQRVDAAVSLTTRRFDETLQLVQTFATGPLRQSSAAIAAFKAAWSVVRHVRDRKRAARDTDEDALFVG